MRLDRDDALVILLVACMGLCLVWLAMAMNFRWYRRTWMGKCARYEGLLLSRGRAVGAPLVTFAVAGLFFNERQLFLPVIWARSAFAIVIAVTLFMAADDYRRFRRLRPKHYASLVARELEDQAWFSSPRWWWVGGLGAVLGLISSRSSFELGFALYAVLTFKISHTVCTALSRWMWERPFVVMTRSTQVFSLSWSDVLLWPVLWSLCLGIAAALSAYVAWWLWARPLPF